MDCRCVTNKKCNANSDSETGRTVNITRLCEREQTDDRRVYCKTLLFNLEINSRQ